MIIVTGGAGFIGSNIVKALCARGETEVVVVDDLTDGTKFRNLVNYPIADYIDKTQFLIQLQQGCFNDGAIKAIFHQGACSATTEWDGRYMMDNNYEYSKTLLHYCLKHRAPFIYASSAAVYGLNTDFSECPEYEAPLNVYGYSKLLFDNYVRRHVSDKNSQVVGLRYFNVYGPNEEHKGSMASVAYHLHQQLCSGDEVRLFQGLGGYGNGEQQRDFVYIDDVVAVNLWFLEHPKTSGIYNVGTGQAQSFNDVANAVIGWHKRGRIDYIPFPEHLKNCYQSYTQADIQALRQVGYTQPFYSVSEGVRCYLDQLAQSVSSAEPALASV